LKLEFHGKGLAGQTIRAALYNSREQFGSEDKFFKAFVVAATGDSVAVSIADVPPGKYAVAAYADANGNGKQDTNFLGKPTEFYGFSNDARAMFGPPEYSEAVFEVGTGVVTQSIHLQ
jgi:uncharacterized protein (DUF2141 family)